MNSGFQSACLNMTDKALIDHFTEVADYSPRPIIIYNVPANTGLGKRVKVLAGSASLLFPAVANGFCCSLCIS